MTGVRWEAVAAADRAYFDKVIAEGGPDAAAMQFPPYCPERSFPLLGEQVRIGRRSRARNITPEIDLTGPPEDPGVSHLHAVLLAQPDGGWLLVDPGSSNGTQVNGRTLQTNVPTRVGPGDRIHLGAWTVITIREGTP
ncbi:FHA domain-containing protein [Nonomuraea fastidiosa]|uniref:FHA domain-containing protein n=1 Tax=Nonomuraea fastidiosa TaxID=46173 RepID=UPI00366E3B1D